VSASPVPFSLGPTPADRITVPARRKIPSVKRVSAVVVALFVTGLAIAGAASAGATLISPASGAVVTTAHPLFTWSLPANEQSSLIYLASNPATTPQGLFFDENVVDVGVFFQDERQWSPTTPLYAGQYWWLVRSNHRESFFDYISPASNFTIPVSLSFVSIAVRRYAFLDQAHVQVRWRANAQEPVVTARAYLGRRLIWSAREKETAFVGSIGTTFLSFRSRRVREGAKLLLRVSIAAQGASKTATARFRAP